MYFKNVRLRLFERELRCLRMTTSLNQLSTSIEYPDTDGKPMAESDRTRVAFLISDDANFITGTTLKVDEARSAAI